MWKRRENKAIPERPDICVYDIRNSKGTVSTVTNIGCSILCFKVKGRDVILGSESLSEYLVNPFYLGAVVGRVANRIGNSGFQINESVYRLPANEGKNHLHGGTFGLSRRIFEAEISGSDLKLRYFSPDGEQGYPGNLKILVTYTLTDQDEFIIRYNAQSDRPTYFAPTSHSYFNLDGHNAGKIDGHRLQIHAGSITPADRQLIPTGEIKPVDDTVYDFRKLREIGKAVYDVNYALDNGGGCAARLESSDGQLAMDVATTFPGMQLYTSDHLNSPGKNGCAYLPRSGICLETQYFPNAVNTVKFDIPVVGPEKPFCEKTIYIFS